MKTYLVGGCVRDELLGLEPKDRDYVVVGSSPAEMLSLGFKPVGESFPVFLHPETNEEYALARVERKSGSGHTGFDVFFDSSVTLEEDLARRDLTINAMAKDVETGEIIDPFDGRGDLENRILRHVGKAFEEDPLRVVRLARFFGRYHDFTVDPFTAELAKTMVQRGDLNELSHERFMLEFEKAFTGSAMSIERFIVLLADFQVFDYVDFFIKIFGFMDKDDLFKAETIAYTCGEMLDVQDRLPVFIALATQRKSICCPQVSNETVDLVNIISPIKYWKSMNGEEIEALISVTRAWGNQTAKFDLVCAALSVAEQTIGAPISATHLKMFRNLGMQVTAAGFPHLTGFELGQAIKQQRINLFRIVKGEFK